MHIAQKIVSAIDSFVDSFLQFIIRMRKLQNYDFCGIRKIYETSVWMETFHQEKKRLIHLTVSHLFGSF